MDEPLLPGLCCSCRVFVSCLLFFAPDFLSYWFARGERVISVGGNATLLKEAS